MNYETLTAEVEGGALIITLNRPPANSIDDQMVLELSQVYNENVLAPEVHAIIITGAGEKIFCAGADLKEGFGTEPEWKIKKGQECFSKYASASKPAIAALNGHALGGGCELALACHFRIIDEKARIGLPESSLGIIPGYGGTQRLARLIGPARAAQYMIFGEQINAEEALRLGLVNAVAKSGEALNDAKALAQRLSERAPKATEMILDAAFRGVEETIEEGLERERRNFIEVFSTKDAKEGIQAFLEKRPAKFTGE